MGLVETCPGSITAVARVPHLAAAGSSEHVDWAHLPYRTRSRWAWVWRRPCEVNMQASEQ